MNLQKEYQEKFFQYLSKKYASETVLHDTMEALNLRKGATYKRMNGETALTSAEMVQLAKHFGVSLDNVFQPEKYISTNHPFWKDEGTTSVDFMDVFSFYTATLTREEESNMIYLANELPIFYYFSHHYIFNFLLAIWNHLHWDDDRLKIVENKEINFKLENFRKDITKYYSNSPITEIWNSNMLSNLYQQIVFSISIRAFEDVKYIENLIKDIRSLIEQLRQAAFTGSRDGKEDGDLKIYLNEFGNYLNVLLYESDSTKAGFIGFDIPQFLITSNEHFFDYSMKWINKIKKRSVLISSDGYQYRELFFMKMENDFKQFEERVEKMVNVYYS